MKSLLSKRVMSATAVAMFLAATNAFAAEKKYETGATDAGERAHSMLEGLQSHANGAGPNAGQAH